jgi:hypothetical protein
MTKSIKAVTWGGHNVHKRSLLDPILSQLNPITIPTLSFFKTILILSYNSLDSSVGIALGYGLDDRGSRVRFPAGAGSFLFTTASRTALGPTQPLIQWVPGAHSMGVKRPGRGADNSPLSGTEVKERVELYLHSPIRLHGVALS